MRKAIFIDHLDIKEFIHTRAYLYAQFYYKLLCLKGKLDMAGTHTINKKKDKVKEKNLK